MSLRLEDIELICRVKYRYWRAIDMGHIEEVRDLLTEDVRVDFVGGSYRWQMEGREVFLSALTQALNPQIISVHTGHHPEIDVLTPTTAKGVWYLTDTFIHLTENIVTEGAALYRDEYLKVDGAWRIKVSTYERIYERVDRLTERPNITAHYLGKTQRPPDAGGGKTQRPDVVGGK
jgi:SnoaL-like protein